VPSPPCPRRPGDPTTEQLGGGEVESGGRGALVGAGAAPQGTGGSILISTSAPRLPHCPLGFLLSCCQLGSADRSELLSARLTGRRERCSPGREERQGAERDARGRGENGARRLLGVVVLTVRPPPHTPEV
jgi:hypothetical protein